MSNWLKNQRYKFEYKLAPHFGRIGHLWTLIGPKGAVHISLNSYEYNKSLQWSGGIECHWAEFHPSHDRAPDHQECWLCKKPCWHDGSSMWITEYLLPRLSYPSNLRMSDHDLAFHNLEKWYVDNIDSLYVGDEA